MIPYIQLERHKDKLDQEEQAAIKKEQWIDDETDRLMQHFPGALTEFCHWRLHPDVMICCYGSKADEVFNDFIYQLAHLQAIENYILQVELRWEESDR
ncbi:MULTISPECIES: host nuclease inhibitor GamL [unclassified Pantoea]|uniref:host nuclease inhibitor GamL n=1 Tax=unclassified Pantoea TaxID=2630326 RepID=UPI001CD343D0|nr:MULTISPECIES: host nuclease inhibitor GamL [unclassified Pantoea]MCA1176670.1 host nuclease inhibitor GamL [Pantoea sp. alder69]MCA1251583.1 host nuclease inhibitor GamL [Pantoea sp. alder70]MCA1264286.1 host nuclease inhibitor GamL [Pantoea sp. alder81]